MADKHTWREEYNTGVSFIDGQHKYFFKIMADIEDSLEKDICRETASRIFFSLAHYAEHYMIQEEIYLKEADFPGIGEHKKLHAGFIERMIKFREDYEKDATNTCESLLPFLNEWFDNHILKYDKDAISYLKGKGL